MKNLLNGITTIWLADDDPEDCGLFAEAVMRALPSARLTFFHNGTDLLVMLKSWHQPDILFLDIVMPQMDGLDCLKEIRKQSHLLRLPIIVFSGLTEQRYIDTAYEYGADLYFTKPFDFNHLAIGFQRLFQFDWQNASTITSAHYINSKFVTYDPLS